MVDIRFITPLFAVAGELEADDFPRLAAAGFRAVISNRPDGEEHGQLTARQEAAAAWRAGLLFRHLPITKHALYEDHAIEGMADLLAGVEGPVLAHCKSGLRAAIAWAAASARSQPVDCVLAALARAGFDLELLREDLEAQAGRKRWVGVPHALDCGAAAAVSSAA